MDFLKDDDLRNPFLTFLLAELKDRRNDKHLIEHHLSKIPCEKLS